MTQANFVRVEGIPVERDALRIAERIHEYDPQLRVQYLDVALQPGEPPFQVVEKCRDGIDRVVLTAWVLDESVIQRVFLADNQKFDINARLDVTNAKAKAQEGRRYKEELAAAREVTEAVLRSPKSTYTVPENVVRGESRTDSTKPIKFKDTK